MFKKVLASVFSLALMFNMFAGVALAGHNGAVVTTDVQSCSPTTFSAEIADPNGTHKVGNMYLTVDDGSSVQSENIPTDGTSADITVGPFSEDTVVSWNVFGGGESSYSQPLWNGFGESDFSTQVADYAASVGGYSWVLSGVEDPNPFVNWNTVEVPGCAPETKDDCKKGGWEAFGFRNQGQCVSSVQANENAGK